jgi:hypothetical protein
MHVDFVDGPCADEGVGFWPTGTEDECESCYEEKVVFHGFVNLMQKYELLLIVELLIVELYISM